MATKRHPTGTCIVCDIARRERHEALREMTARADYSRDRLPDDRSIYDCDFCGAGPGDCHCGDHSDGPGGADG